MALATQFSKGLEKLFTRRTHWLHRAIGKGRPGPAPAFTSKKVKPNLDKLVTIARKMILKERGQKEFRGSYVEKRQWQVNKRKGWGKQAKKKNFSRWYTKNIRGRNCVYVFWSGRKCEYVGRTINGKGRPISSFGQSWFRTVTRLDIYKVPSPTLVPRAECLAIDLFNPRQNEYSASHPKYAKRCPICTGEKKIKRELKAIFPFRRKKRKRKGK